MSDMLTLPTRHRITVDEYHRMGEAGIFPHDARIELFDGDLIETRVGMKPPHASVVSALNVTLVVGLKLRAVLRCQLPITLGDLHEPEPDFTIVQCPGSRYSARHPGPSEILCAIEVADSSRDFDVRRKAPLYAAFGIPETWVVDFVDECVHVFREPKDAAYTSTSTATFADELALLAFPDVRVRVTDALSR